MIHLIRSRKLGFALIFALAVTAIMTAILIAFAVIAYSDLGAAANIANSVRAYYAAEAGMTKKFIELRAGNTSSLSETFPIATNDNASYQVIVTNVSGGAFPTYRLTSTGTYRRSTRQISYDFKQVSHARFAYLSNDEDQLFWWGERHIWFISGDVLRGPMHSNDMINISEDPTFEGPVSSSADIINYYHGGPPEDNPDFRESLSLGIPTVQLPGSAGIINSILTQSQQAGGLYLTGDTVLTFLPNGTIDVTNADMDWDTPHNIPAPVNGAIFVNGGYVDVSGTVSGQFTVGTSRSIYVTGNLTYLNDPRTSPSSTDIIGLVAQNNVYVDSAAPYDVEINACIVALNTSFGVENYGSGLKGTLSIYGGIIQYRRGPIGTFSASTGDRISGYTKDYVYDTRFQNIAPPYFPVAVDANGMIIYVKTLYTES